MTRRTVLLVIALLIAALGTSMIVLYVKGIDARAAQGQELVEVLTATSVIPVGQTLAEAQREGKVDKKQVRRADLAPDALSDATAVGAQAALADIHPGQQLLAAMFGTPARANGLGLKDGQVAVSLSLSDPQRVADFVTPGSRIGLYVTADVPDDGGKTVPYTDLLLPEVAVLGVGAVTQAAEGEGEKTQGEATQGEATQGTDVVFTLAVDQSAAQKVIFAARNAQLTFVLLGDRTQLKQGKGTRLRDVVPDAFGR